MDFKVIAPRRGWSRILWSQDDLLAKEAMLALEYATKVPGVELYIGYIEIPATAYFTEPVVELLTQLNCDWACMMTIPKTKQVWDYESNRKLYMHQWEGAHIALNESPTGGLLLADDMGLGKTATAIAAAEGYMQRFDSPKKALVIGPGFSREVWRSELLAMGAISKPDDLCVIRTRNIDSASYNRDARWTFIHYDIAHAWRLKLRSEENYTPDVCIIDEAHWIKNGRAQRSKATLIIASVAKLRIALTGTPLENRPSDLWHPLTVVTGPGTFGYPLAFRRRYCGAYYSGFGWQDGEPTNIDELRERLEVCYLRRTVADTGIALPSLTRSSRLVPLRDVERRDHDEILRSVSVEKLVRAVLEGQVRDVLPMLTRLRQATSAGKLSATAELITDFQEQGESVVVFSWERQTAQALALRVKGWVVTGEYDLDDRAHVVEEFQKHGGILCATYGALKEGVTLHRARIVVLHDLHWVLSALLQAERRIHRIGQYRACQSIWVVGENSIDTILASALLTKAQLAEEILGITEGVVAVGEVSLKDLVGEEDFEKRTARMLKNWEASL